MNDCIERKKAIDLIQPHVKPQTVYGEGYLQAIQHATDILELMPAADVQPVKRGRWFHLTDESIVYCSECNSEAYWDTDYGQQLFDYCPYCGAKMTKEGDTE